MMNNILGNMEIMWEFESQSINQVLPDHSQHACVADTGHQCGSESGGAAHTRTVAGVGSLSKVTRDNRSLSQSPCLRKPARGDGASSTPLSLAQLLRAPEGTPSRGLCPRGHESWANILKVLLFL